MVMVKALGRTESAITITAYMSLVMTPLSLGPALLHWTWPTLEQYAWLILLGGLGGLGQLLFTQALRLGETHVVTPMDFLRLVYMSLFGFLIFDQVPDKFVWIGAVMIFSAVAFIAYREHVRRSQASVTATEPGGGT